MKNSIVVVIALTLSPFYAFGHGGGLDSRGGHNGPTGYHYHGGSTSNASSIVPFIDMEAMEVARQRRAAFEASMQAYRVRTKAKKDAREAAREAARARVRDSTQSPKYLFHHVTFSPYEVVSFADGNKVWDCMLAKGYRVNLPKDKIVRIESIDDPHGPRTWKDATEKYSTVATCIHASEELVELETLEGASIEVNMRKLSGYDKRHVAEKLLR